MSVPLYWTDCYKNKMEFLVGPSMLQCVDAFLQLICIRFSNGIVQLGILHLADVDNIVSTVYQQIYLHTIGSIVMAAKLRILIETNKKTNVKFGIKLHLFR